MESGKVSSASPRPLLCRFAIDNYRSCYHTTFDCHPKLSVLIGPNGSGKTNILQSIMLLQQLAMGERFGMNLARQPVTPHLSASFTGVGTKATLAASVEVRTDESNRDRATGIRERLSVWDKNGDHFRYSLPLSLGLTGETPWSRQQYMVLDSRRHRLMLPATDEVPSWYLQGMKTVARLCAGMRYYSASLFTNPGTCPVSITVEREGERSRLPHRGPHANTLYSMYSA
jgi:hypothetical protein